MGCTFARRARAASPAAAQPVLLVDGPLGGVDDRLRREEQLLGGADDVLGDVGSGLEEGVDERLDRGRRRAGRCARVGAPRRVGARRPGRSGRGQVSGAGSGTGPSLVLSPGSPALVGARFGAFSVG